MFVLVNWHCRQSNSACVVYYYCAVYFLADLFRMVFNIVLLLSFNPYPLLPKLKITLFLQQMPLFRFIDISCESIWKIKIYMVHLIYQYLTIFPKKLLFVQKCSITINITVILNYLFTYCCVKLQWFIRYISLQYSWKLWAISKSIHYFHPYYVHTYTPLCIYVYS